MHFLRRIILHTKNMITVFLLVYLFETVMSASIAQATTTPDEMSGEVDEKTWIISDTDGQTQLFSDLIHILHRLSVFSNDDNRSSCVTLERVERQTMASLRDDRSRSVNVVLQFQQRHTHPDITSTDARADDVSGGYSAPSTVIACKQRSIFPPRPGIDSLSRKQTNGTVASTESSDINGTVMAQPSSPASKKERGLSRTQIAVIATCAAVLGTLFIIVAGLRVRSCLRRYRTNRETALNITRRASSMGLNGSNNVSTTNVRRDSSSSKASRQSNTTFKSGGDVSLGGRHALKTHFLAHNTSPLHSYDHKPLLPVTSAGSHSDKGSSHGSLAFIDDTDTHSKFKDLDAENESDTGTEDDPLLRKSPDSGSSLDASLADICKLENESMTFDPDNGVLQEGLADVVSQCNDTRLSSDNVQALSTGLEIAESNTNVSDLAESNNEGSPSNGGMEASLAEPASELGRSNTLKGDEKAESTDMCLARALAVTSGLCQSDGSLSNGPSYQYGNQAEYAWGVYGNVAYCCPFETDPDLFRRHHHGVYAHVAAAMGDMVGLDIERHGRENGLSPEDRMLMSDKKSPSELSYRSLSISNTSSGEPLLPSVCRSRTPSDGNILIYGRDNWALDDSAEEEANGQGSGPTGSNVTPNTNTCRVVSQIIPLAIYNEPNGRRLNKEKEEDKIGMT